MLQIYKPIDTIIKAVGKQNIKQTEYRFLTYIQYCNVGKGMLLYNIMTRELIFLNDEEADDFLKCNSECEIGKYLIENWFLVPQNNDDYLLFRQLDNIFRLASNGNTNVPLKTFVIYPTTDCNARCFYCFELACNRINMTEQTAHNVADFIKRKGDKKVKIQWFGGEPLYNMPAIDIITGDLIKYGIEFESMMVSNGYLFDDSVVEKAVKNWNLNHIQITLDGTEEIYNKTKNYIYKNVSSPFFRVLDNIERLLKNNVRVQIRLNMDENNCDDLKQLVIQLTERFSRFKKFMVYVKSIYNFENGTYIPRSPETQLLLHNKFIEIYDILGTKSRESKQLCTRHRFANQCMADSNTTTTILPDGKLGKCEHYTDDNYYGNIYSDVINYSVINRFKERSLIGTDCHTCCYAPLCYSLKMCSYKRKECYEADKKEAKLRLDQMMRNSYEKFLTNKSVEDNTVEFDDFDY